MKFVYLISSCSIQFRFLITINFPIITMIYIPLFCPSLPQRASQIQDLVFVILDRTRNLVTCYILVFLDLIFWDITNVSSFCRKWFEKNIHGILCPRISWSNILGHYKRLEFVYRWLQLIRMWHVISSYFSILYVSSFCTNDFKWFEKNIHSILCPRISWSNICGHHEPLEFLCRWLQLI